MMFENVYTTKMSVSRKTLQARFQKIRSKTPKFSRLTALALSVALAVTCLTATYVLAAVNAVDKTVYVYAENTLLELKNEPFFYGGTVYLPLRECFEKIGFFDDGNRIDWDNGKITIYLHNQNEYYEMQMGDNRLILDTLTHEVNSRAELEEPCAPVLMNDVTYIPYEFAVLILNQSNSLNNTQYALHFVYADINSKEPYLENAEGITYTDICGLQYRTYSGHFPWRLDAREVIKTFGLSVENGEISNFSENGAECKAVYTANGSVYDVELFKPIRKDAFGIWVVKTFEERK